MLEKEELKQYQRQIILPELGLTGQQKLKSAKILIVGAGGLGCPALQYLVAAGIGTIGIIDADVVELSNLHRQILYATNDVGKLKAETAKEKLAALNPNVQINAYPVRLTSLNAITLFSQYDLIIDGSDNFKTRYLTNDTCVALSKPLVFGSILKFEGQVSIFNYLKGPNYRDIFPDSPAAQEAPNCSEVGVIGILTGIIGLYMANEAIKICCEFGETLSGKLMTYNALNNKMNIFNFNSPVKLSTAQEKTIDLARPVEEIKNGEISLDDLKKWLDHQPDQVCLIDVRENFEFEDYHLGGLNIPLYELSERLGEVPMDKKIVIICQTGQRSKIAINLLRPFFKGELLHAKYGL
ncbi:molybdopterin/thiamine biosynthesis adenylyltransferase [Pedobacter sp. CG_S7]|uniref:HesA/MoeB/ThiF family protein n=1 Tax=Pedobacter sp. CG_S7 TaxID=3143930 RepID=UPI0033972F3A